MNEEELRKKLEEMKTAIFELRDGVRVSRWRYKIIAIFYIILVIIGLMSHFQHETRLENIVDSYERILNCGALVENDNNNDDLYE